MGEGTFVGLDVHARSVVAGLIDQATGELAVRRAPHRSDELVGWLGALSSPVRVTYEAGPTGFGLARACERAGIDCLVAAPSLIARAPAERGRKRDAADAQLLARALRAGQLRPVRVPDPIDEAARDLVRAREDARADLMRARHRLSKLLLRHGRLYRPVAPGRAPTRPGWPASASSIPARGPPWRTPAAPSWPLGCAVMASTPASRSSRPTRALPRWSGACRACAGSAR